ncbi:hypothetical protein CLOP_g11819 [Closterium sp. NIES-67]|nr:hypothetical protein CLOP_g11819 [Closterium sp. NIES-67]
MGYYSPSQAVLSALEPITVEPDMVEPIRVKPTTAEPIAVEPITVDVFPAVFLERDYEFLGEIGSGQYGKVWRCRSRLTGRQFACKQVKKRSARTAGTSRSGRGQQGRKGSAAQGETREQTGGKPGADCGESSGGDVDPIEREIAALTHLEGCVSVTSLHGVFEDASSVFLLMDFCDRGDLFSLIADTDGVPEDEARQLFADVARAVKECHKRGVLHRDLKPDNVLLSLRDSSSASSASSAPSFRGFRATSAAASCGANAAPREPSASRRRYDVKLADFGLSVILKGGGRVRGYAGSFPYEAPEVVGLKAYSFAADIWSMGVLLYALLSANWPEFRNRQALNEETDWTGASWDQVSEEAKDLIRRLLTVDQDRRPTIDDVLRHPWLAPATRVDRSESVDSVDCLKEIKSKQNLSLLPPLLIPSESLDSRESTSLESASSIPSEASFLSALAATPASLPTPTARNTAAAATNATASTGTYHTVYEGSEKRGAGKRSAEKRPAPGGDFGRTGKGSSANGPAAGGLRGRRAASGGSAGVRSNCASRGSSASETLPVSDNIGVREAREASCDCMEGCGLKGCNPTKDNPKSSSHQLLRKRGSAGNAEEGEEPRGPIVKEERRRCFSEPAGPSGNHGGEKASAKDESSSSGSPRQSRNKENYLRGSPPARRGSFKEYAVQVVSSLRWGNTSGNSWQPGCFCSIAQPVAPEAGCDEPTDSPAAPSPAVIISAAYSAAPSAVSCGASRAEDVPTAVDFGAPKSDTTETPKSKESADMDVLRAIETHLSAFFMTKQTRKCA